jgi:hypothetical protein
MTTATPTVITVNSTPVDFLPLVTPYSAPTSCSNYIYRQLDSTYLAFDPYYGSYIDTDAATCQPTQVVSWWSQASGAVTTTALGTTFNCPALYSTVTTTTTNGFQHVYCCPSYGAPAPSSFVHTSNLPRGTEAITCIPCILRSPAGSRHNAHLTPHRAAGSPS